MGVAKKTKDGENERKDMKSMGINIHPECILPFEQGKKGTFLSFFERAEASFRVFLEVE